MKAIHQLVAGFTLRDAISNEARLFQRIFQSWGFASELFAEGPRIHPSLRETCHDLGELQRAIRPDDVVILHLSTGSHANQVLKQLKCRRVILYHNITPPSFFEEIQDGITGNLSEGLHQARQLADTAEIAMAHSRFSAGDLETMGYRDVRVLPLLLDRSAMNTAPDQSVVKRYRDGVANILFVGRCVPNKRIEHALLAFSHFQRTVNPQSRFIHIGSHQGTEQYRAMLLTQARYLELKNVEWLGSQPQPFLNAMYDAADLFLCMSEHEGFCIPLLESMQHGLPIVAYAAGAVPETLDGSGVLFSEKNYPLIAETMGQLVQNKELREAVVARQEESLQRYTNRNLEDELREHLGSLLA